MSEVIHPGIPGENYWFTSRGAARKAALRFATRMGPGYRVTAHGAHAPGQLPHYHVVAPGGNSLHHHFFYGRRPPRKAPKGARQRRRRLVREYEGGYEPAGSRPESDLFWDDILDWFRPKPSSVSVTITPRSAWGAAPARCSSTLRLPVSYAFIHHTAGSAPSSQSAERSTMRGIQQYHQNGRGWCDVAYNFVIMPSGRVYEGRGWNRVNAATKGYNSNSLAFCWAGNYENSSPTKASIDAGRALLSTALSSGYLTPGFVLRGHRDAASTACPGRYLYARLRDIDPRP